MKKKTQSSKKHDFDLETLKRWKYSSTKAKLDWLEAALKFFKLKHS